LDDTSRPGAPRADRPLSILFVDDDPLAVDALESSLDPLDEILLRCVWGHPSDALAACTTHAPDAALVNLVLPSDGPDGIELAVALQATNPGCVAVITASSTSQHDANRAWLAGIRGYLKRTRLVRDVEQLPLLLTMVINGGVFYEVDPRVASKPSREAGELSPREVEVLGRKAAGLRHREIADELFVSVRTVDSHLTNVRRKLGASTIREALDIANERGLISPQHHA
jgi:DNA-binding NarL/FixJ family response regulator